ALYGKRIDKSNKQDIEHLLSKLKFKEAKLQYHHLFAKQLEKTKILKVDDAEVFSNSKELNSKTDYLISVGGDGTFLDTILLVRDKKIPVLGINTGRLGFISNTPPEDIDFAINSLYEKKYTLDYRSMIKMDSDTKHFGADNYALNEISILKRDTSSMITIEVSLDGGHLNTYWADGLIISTATGSTAYSLSCGGPILMPGSGNFVITPIAPHNLNVRPIVIDNNSTLDITVEARAKKNLIALDSRSAELKNGEKFRIQKAPFKVAIIQLEKQNFITSLRSKLNWGLDKRNT
ncbi:MAG: NAD kinase, partial [Vicingaceae bacterium]